MIATNKVLITAALGEIATGIALLLVPSLVGQVLLGTALTGTAVVIARVAGIALLGLGMACWPGPARIGMLTYGAGASIYLGYLGFVGVATGLLLWPAVILHVVLTLALILKKQ